MKNILYTIILSFLFSSVCLAEVYYCVEEAKTGFENANSRKPIPFSEKKFTIEIKDDQASSESIFFHPEISPPCIITEVDDGSTLVSCTNWAGASTFKLNLTTMVFSLTFSYITIANKDSIFIAVGKCEKFN